VRPERRTPSGRRKRWRRSSPAARGGVRTGSTIAPAASGARARNRGARPRPGWCRIAALGRAAARRPAPSGRPALPHARRRSELCDRRGRRLGSVHSRPHCPAHVPRRWRSRGGHCPRRSRAAAAARPPRRPSSPQRPQSSDRTAQSRFCTRSSAARIRRAFPAADRKGARAQSATSTASLGSSSRCRRTR
jgi:hypothetical protein